MRKNRQNKRMLLTVAVILCLAFVGLFMVQVDRVSADGSGQVAPGTALQSESGVPTAQETGVIGAIVKMISALVVVIASVYLGIYLLKRLTQKRPGQNTKSDVLEVLQTTHLGPHKAISLVKVGKRSVLVGVTDSRISTLTELDEAETQEMYAQAPSQEAGDSFAGTLKNATGRLRSFTLRSKRTVLGNS